MIKIKTSICLLLFASLFLSSCIKEPKKLVEEVTSSEEFEKIVDEVIGTGSINPNGIAAGDTDTLVQTLNISNSLVREIFRRKLKVLSVTCDTANCTNARQWDYQFEVEIIQRDANGQPQNPISVVRNLTLKVNQDGFYEFYGDQHDQAIFSWDTILDLRGFCRSFKTEDYDVQISCSNLKVESEIWGKNSIPVRKISINRSVVLTNLGTNEVIESKLRYNVRFGTQQKEISKVVSFCSEGLQKIENQVYFITRCNNLEDL